MKSKLTSKKRNRNRYNARNIESNDKGSPKKSRRGIDNEYDNVEEARIQTNDALAEAMILLDPPLLPQQQSSIIEPPHLKEAYDLLITACSISNGWMEASLSAERSRLTSSASPSVNSNDNGDDGDSRKVRWDEEVMERSGRANIFGSKLKKFGNAYVNADSDGEFDMTAIQSALPLLSDVYRALILSCHLLLEMCPWKLQGQLNDQEQDTNQKIHFVMEEQNNDDHQLEQHEIIILYQTIRKSILVLQRFSLLSSLACTLSGDWHDEYLPKSQHPLLQECFQRREMMNIEDGVVFGKEERLISLELEDYHIQNILSSHYHSFSQREGEDLVGASSAKINGSYDRMLECYHNVYPNQNSDFIDWEDDDGGERSVGHSISINFDPVQLANEEEQLLDIAFPDSISSITADRSNSKNIAAKSIIGTSNDRPSLPTKEWIQMAISCNILTLIWDQCRNRPVPIVKEGWLVMTNNIQTCTKDKDSSQIQSDRNDTSQCYVQLFENGLLTVENRSTNKKGKNVGINGRTIFIIPTITNLFLLSSKTLCTPVVEGDTFHFQLRGVEQCSRDNIKVSEKGQICDNPEHEKWSFYGDNCSVSLGVDEITGGSFMDGYSWVTDISRVTSLVTERDRLQILFEAEWGLTGINEKDEIIFSHVS